MPNTPRGFPYPTPADPVSAGANDMRALAEAIDSNLANFAEAAWVAAIEATAGAAARGIVATAPLTAGPLVIGAGQNAVVTNSLAFTPLVGRRYRLVAQLRAISPALPVGDNYWNVQGSNSIAPADLHFVIATDYASARFEAIFAGTGLASTYVLSILSEMGLNAYTDGPASFYYLEDLGASLSAEELELEK